MPVGRNDSRAIAQSSGELFPSTIIRSLSSVLRRKVLSAPKSRIAPEFFVPLMMAKQIEPGSTWLDQRDSDNLFVIGRLKRDVTPAQASPNWKRSRRRWRKNIRQKMPAAEFS